MLNPYRNYRTTESSFMVLLPPRGNLLKFFPPYHGLVLELYVSSLMYVACTLLQNASFTHHSVFEISSMLSWLSVVCSFLSLCRIPLNRYCTVYLPINGHLGCFQFLTIMNRTTKHYCKNLFVDVCFHFFLFLFDCYRLCTNTF